ncbi:MAG: helix-turn-helix domain-containing protein [Rhodocyclaceae bacterium]|nr:helix-turn-helix domain-containing protein [Rhodocyclaceae bacterium]
MRTVKMIERIRAQHQACTLGFLSSQMRIAKSTMQRTVHQLRELGYVDYTDMPGSLHVTDAGRDWIAPRDDDEQPPAETTQVAPPAPPAPAKKAAAKKAAARKAPAKRASSRAAN